MIVIDFINAILLDIGNFLFSFPVRYLFMILLALVAVKIFIVIAKS